MFCTRCGNVLNDGEKICPACGNPTDTGSVNITTTLPKETLPGMGWYNFLVRVALILGCLVNIYQSVQALTGFIYDSDPEIVRQVYAYYGPALKASDVIYGILCLFMAGFCIYTRNRLRGFKIEGPGCVYALYTMNVLIPMLYVGLIYIATGTTPGLLSFIESAFGIVMLAVNLVYFKKRRLMFVN
ncbi:MAG: zinc ribbon domain-containing protein [Lachnospiraceae bacterium]|nr:zinc ribbon domain-containing protein [Lachnospiraceae bacterium]